MPNDDLFCITSGAKLVSSISLPSLLQRYDEGNDFCESKIYQTEFETVLQNCQCFKNRRCSFPCDVCGKHFDYMFLLEKHFLIHNELNLLNCDICGMIFKKNSTLRLHLFKHRLCKISPPKLLDLFIKLGIICI